MGQRVIGSGSLFFDFPFFPCINLLFYWFVFFGKSFLSSDCVGTLLFFLDTTETVGSILQVPRGTEIVAVT